MVFTVINESSRTALECALRCDCIAKTETGKFESAVKDLKDLLLVCILKVVG